GMRVEFVCGTRALADYQDRVQAMVEAALRAHTSDREVLATLERAQAERATLAKEVRRLGEELARAEARASALQAGAAAGADGTAAWARLVDERDPAGLKALATAAIGRGALVVIVAAARPEPALVIARERELPTPDLRTLA